jgi:hypothetical protein
MTLHVSYPRPLRRPRGRGFLSLVNSHFSSVHREDLVDSSHRSRLDDWSAAQSTRERAAVSESDRTPILVRSLEAGGTGLNARET